MAANRANLRRWSWRVIRVLLLIYAGLAIVLLAAQKYMIFPGAVTQGRPDAMVRPGSDAELVRMRTADGDEVVAIFGAAQSPAGTPLPDAATRPTILFFYGNGMCMADCWREFKMFRRLGANVMVPDYLGYGMSGGEAGEKGVYATADAAYDHLLTRKDIDSKRIVPAGWSLGAAAAIHLASTRPAAGLMTFSAFTSAVDVGKRVYPFLPISLMLRHRFENERKMASVGCPVLIIHGRRDSIIAHDMAARLAAAAGGPVTRLDLDTDHNDLFEQGGDELATAVRRFLEAIP